MRTIDNKPAPSKPEEPVKRPDRGILEKSDAYPGKPDSDSREHYKNAERLKREINPTGETKPKSPRANPDYLIRRIGDLEEYIDELEKGK